MRLFIGIKTHCENHLQALQNELRQAGRGNFTYKDNLHITLKFLGEVPPEKTKAIQRAMEVVTAKPFDLECGGAHLFNRSGIAAAKVGGDIAALTALHAELEMALERGGFEKEQRRYRPHITLARKYRPNAGAGIEAIPYLKQRFTVDEIILFESKRMDGRLVYEKVSGKRLE